MTQPRGDVSHDDVMEGVEHALQYLDGLTSPDAATNRRINCARGALKKVYRTPADTHSRDELREAVKPVLDAFAEIAKHGFKMLPWAELDHLEAVYARHADTHDEKPERVHVDLDAMVRSEVARQTSDTHERETSPPVSWEKLARELASAVRYDFNPHASRGAWSARVVRAIEKAVEDAPADSAPHGEEA